MTDKLVLSYLLFNSDTNSFSIVPLFSKWRGLLDPQLVSNQFDPWDASYHFGGPVHLIR